MSIPESSIQLFIERTDNILKNMPSEPIYFVDYIFRGKEVNGSHILDIAALEDLWGKDMPEPYIAVESLKITANMVTVYAKKNLTLKIALPSGISLMLFNAPEELCNQLQNENPGYIEFNIVGRANKNEWNGNITPQIFIENYEITSQSKYFF